MNDGVLHHPHIKATPPPPPPSKSQLKEISQQMCKQKRAVELEGTFDTLKAEGYTLVFTDGASVEVDGVGRVAGCWIYAHPDVSIATHMPVTLPNQQHCRTFSGHPCPTDFYIGQDCNLHRQRVCLFGCHGSGKMVAVKRVGWEQRPDVECPIV